MMRALVIPMIKIPPLEKWTMVEVVWHDASSRMEQLHSKNVRANNCFRSSLGYFIKINGNELIIAGTDDRLSAEVMQGDCDDLTYIPLGMVKCIITLCRATKKKTPPQ
jgi:hypothetical protein